MHVRVTLHVTCVLLTQILDMQLPSGVSILGAALVAAPADSGDAASSGAAVGCGPGSQARQPPLSSRHAATQEQQQLLLLLTSGSQLLHFKLRQPQ